jgi:hypothetical protein
MGDGEFKDGLDERYARVVIAASDCVRHLRRQLTGTMGKADEGRLLTVLSQTRFNPVYQGGLVEAVLDLHDFETGSGKYRLTDAERLAKLEVLASEDSPQPWIIAERDRLRARQPTN